MRGFSVPVVAAGAEQLEPIKFSGSGLRWPVTSASNATNRFFLVEWWHHTPDYETSDLQFAYGAFVSPSSGGETLIDPAESIVIQGVSVELGTDNWVSCDGASESGVATLTAANPNTLTPRINTTLAPSTAYRCRAAFVASSTSMDIPRNSLQPSGDSVGGQGRVEGSTASRFSRLSESGTTSNSGGIYFTPGFCIARGGGNRASVLVVGDSIGYGANDTQATAGFGPRNEVGFIERGLLDNTGALELPNHIMCIPGQRPAGAFGWETQSNWANKIACLELARAASGDWPFDFVHNEHLSNSVPFTGNLQTAMAGYFDLLTMLFGKPITGYEGFSAVTSNNGYADLAGQTPRSGYDQASTDNGHMWPYNDALRAGTFTSNGVMGSIAAWETIAADTTGTDRDIYPVQPFSSTLASTFTSGSTVVLTDAPPVQASINILQNNGDYGPIRTVRTVTGSGPFTVGLSGSAGSAASSGNVVRETWGDNLHPSGLNHIAAVPAITSWKVAQGYVPPNSAPAFTSSAITGTAEDGEVLTANYEATGFPVPTPTYQWQFDGVIISGQTGSTITLDQSGMSLTDQATISCEITLTNTEGSDSAEPTIIYNATSGAVNTFLSTISGSSESGYFDCTTARIASSDGRFEVDDENGNEKFRSLGVSVNPGIDGTDGATFGDATTVIARTQTSANYTLTFTMTKDDGIGDSADAFLDSNIRMRSGSASALSDTVFVDGTEVTTRGALYSALDDELEHTVEVRGTSSTQLRVGRSGSGFTGSVRRIAVINETDAGANLSTWRTEAIAAVEA